MHRRHYLALLATGTLAGCADAVDVVDGDDDSTGTPAGSPNTSPSPTASTTPTETETDTRTAPPTDSPTPTPTDSPTPTESPTPTPTPTTRDRMAVEAYHDESSQHRYLVRLTAENRNDYLVQFSYTVVFYDEDQARVGRRSKSVQIQAGETYRERIYHDDREEVAEFRVTWEVEKR